MVSQKVFLFCCIIMKYKHNIHNIESINRAIIEWEKSDLSWREISKKHGIKIGTLKYHYYEKNKNKSIDIVEPRRSIRTQNVQIKNAKKKDPYHEMYKCVVPCSNNEQNAENISIQNKQTLQDIIKNSQTEELGKKKRIRVNINELIDPQTGKTLF